MARDYVLYREERAKVRAANAVAAEAPSSASRIHVVAKDGGRHALDLRRVRQMIEDACRDLTDVDPDRIINDALANMYDGMAAKDISVCLTMAARALVGGRARLHLR